MRRIVLTLLVLFIGTCLAFVAWAQSEIAASEPPSNGPEAVKRALVLWHAEDAGTTSELHAAMTANLFGRFGRSDVRPISTYRAGDLQSYDALFVLPSPDRRIPRSLLADVRTSPRPVLWMQHGAPALFADPDFKSRQGWGPGPQRRATFAHVTYKGIDLPYDARGSAWITDPLIADAGRAQVLAVAVEPDGRTTPWAVRSGNFFFVLENPFVYAHEDDRYLAFADLLYEMVAPGTPTRRRAMVRIEDVGPEANPARIRALADLLAAEGVPFAMTVYDTYRDPDGYFNGGKPLRFSLRQRPSLVRALEYAQSKGGTLIAHGHTHQNDARRNPYVRVSGGDFEFFAANLRDGAFVHIGPLPGNSTEMWRERFEESRRAWRRADLPLPPIFTTPHYAGSLEAYRAAMEFYGARYERVLYFPGELTTGLADYERESKGQFFPYETVDVRGDLILPENLGYSSSTERGGYFGRESGGVLASARRNLVVRDGFASFFHHWFEDIDTLRETVQGIKKLGYRFVSPTDVVRDAPAHADRRLHEPAPLAAAAAAWIAGVPRLTGPLLVGLFLPLVTVLVLLGKSRTEEPR